MSEVLGGLIMPGGEKASRKQVTALAALLTSSTITAAARQSGVSETSLRRWLQQPDFRRRYWKARRNVLNDAIGRLQLATGQAVEALVSLVADAKAPGTVRVAAAKAIFKLGQLRLDGPPEGNHDRTLEALGGMTSSTDARSAGAATRHDNVSNQLNLPGAKQRYRAPVSRTEDVDPEREAFINELRREQTDRGQFNQGKAD
jgi:transposase-like protein